MPGFVCSVGGEVCCRKVRTRAREGSRERGKKGRETERQTDRQTVRQTVRQTQTDGDRYRQTERF